MMSLLVAGGRSGALRLLHFDAARAFGAAGAFTVEAEQAGVHVMWMQTDGHYYGYSDHVLRVTGVNIVKNDQGRFGHLAAMIAKGASETLMKEVGM
jgi:hypothetical protein